MGSDSPSVDPLKNGRSKNNVHTLQTSSPSKQDFPPEGDPMDVTPTATNPMGPPLHSSPEEDQHTELPNGSTSQHTSHSTAANAAAAASTSAQPKLVNTAFIHKLYKLVE